MKRWIRNTMIFFFLFIKMFCWKKWLMLIASFIDHFSQTYMFAEKGRYTLTPQKKNRVHSIALHIVIFKKTLTKMFSSWFHASFDILWVQIDPLRYEHWSFECSMKCHVYHFLSKMAYFIYFAILLRSIPLKIISEFGLKRFHILLFSSYTPPKSLS